MVNIAALWLCLLAASEKCECESDDYHESGFMYLPNLSDDDYDVEKVEEHKSVAQWWKENWDNVLVYTAFGFLMLVCVVAIVLTIYCSYFE